MVIGIITGASSGLGTEYALQAAKQCSGIDEFWLIARRTERLEALKEKLSGKKVRVFGYDLSDLDTLTAFEKLLSEERPDIGLLINNAGFGRLQNVADSAIADNAGMVDVNVRALSVLTGIALKHMKRGAVILNVCSIASFVPTPRMTVYCSTKAYVLSYTKALREELKPQGINVSCVCPPPMSTEFMKVASIEKGGSPAFDTLPRANPAKVAETSLRRALKGKCVTTPMALYKLYRFLSRIVPHNIFMKFTKC